MENEKGKNEAQKEMLQEFKWNAPEFEKKEKEKTWFILPAIITVMLGVFALLTDNTLFMIAIVLSFFVFYVYAKKQPRIITFKINEKGVEIDNRLYEFDELRSFWVFYDPPLEKTLSFRSKKTFFPYLRVALAEENPNEIRKFLLKFLPEKRHRESIIDIWMKRIGF